MAFTQVNLQTQQLLESTFISDMRIIINANTILLKNVVQDAFNALEIDSVNKKIGVDNPLTSIYTSSLRLGTSMLFTDGATTIAQLSKASGKSKFELDQIAIKAGGSIDALGAESKIAVTRLGVGVANIAALTADGLYIGANSMLSVQGQASFSNSPVMSSESVTLTLAQSSLPSGPVVGTYECDITLNSTSKSNIELALVYPITATAANAISNPVILVNVYTSATNPPAKGQEFSFYVKSVKGNDNTQLNSTWQNAANLRIKGGYDATKNRVLINQQSTAFSTSNDTAAPHLRFNGVPNFGGVGSIRLVDTTVPMRFVATSAVGLCTVAQS